MEITRKNMEQESSSSSDSNNNKKKEEQQKVAFYKLFSFADSWDLVLMIVGTISAVANGVAQPLLALFIGQVINEFGTSDPKHVVHHVSTVSLKFLYLATYTGIACFLQVTCWIVTGERQSARIRGLYLKTLLRQDIAFFDMETTTSEVINRISGDTALIQDAIGEKVGNFIQIIATFVGGFATAFIRGWLLACVLLSSIPCLVFVGAIMSVLMTKTSSLAQQAYTDAGNIVEQTVGAIRTVASFTGEKDAAKKYSSKILIAYKATVKQGLVSGLGLGAFLFVMLSTYALAVWYGAKLIIDKDYNGGQVLNVIMVMMIGGMSLGQSSPYLNAFSAGQAAAYKMFEAIQRTPKIDASTTEGIILEDIKGEIELKDVNFRYPARPDVQIFSNFSLYIASGSTVALVGESGSGKSTIVSLIERFYDPDSGEVLIDGVNLKQLQLAWIRQKIGLVSQEPVLFTTTLKENIAYGKVDATDDEIRTAIQLANAAKFIDKLPKGLNTLVGERGTQLSGGQKQRIAIARAILKNPRILLLDEATSALDTESEHIVQDALDRIMTNRTTLIIAHRLTTIKNVDMIAIVHQGKIIERGSHKDLIKDPDGSYSQLVKLHEGTKEKETSSEYATSLHMIPNLDRSLSTSSSQRYSMRKTRGSSSGRNSISVNFSIPGYINIQETVGGYPSHDCDDTISKSEVAYEKLIREKSKIVSLKRLVSMNKQEVPILVLGTIAAAIQGTIFPLFGYLISSVIKVFYEPTALLRRDSRKWALIYLSLGFVSFLTIPIQNFLFAIAGGKLIQRIRKMTFEKVIYQEVKYFDDPANSSGAIGARLATDAVNIKSLVGDRLGLIMQNIATLSIGLLIAFTANWMLALIVLAVGPLMFAQGYIQGKFMDGFSGDAMLKYEEASQVANDAVGSIRTVASFCAEKKMIDLYEKKCEGPVKAGVRLGLISGLSIGFSFFILFCTNAFCFYIGAILIHHGKATFAEVFKVFLALVFTAATLSQSSSMAMDMNKAKESAVSIFKILDSKPKIDASTNEGITQESITGDIEFSHVSFRYPTRPDIQIFKDFSLCIPSSKTVALVGESGSGKSTIISMIERFYEPYEGQIFLDGVELHKFKLRWLRQQMGLVSQEPVLFNETIRANITYGMQQGTETENEIIKAAKAANAHNFISSLPQGYETLVGERGIQLSGGQKQRIAIARAILKNPKILLLDEATSALDVESESIVQNALDNVMVGRTTVVVAHRLGTIRNVDIIAVIKNGTVIEKGNHNELMKIPQGAYASLVSLHANVASSS